MKATKARCGNYEFNIYPANYGRAIYLQVNSRVQVRKYHSRKKGEGIVYGIIVDNNNYVNLKRETALALRAALKVLTKDTSVEESYNRGALVIDLKTGTVLNR
ncbi:hypothetical protein LJC45_02700 [Alistipes sp. OttesenSCG-928-B03]|nr:hypothetical protein [Alistipes sp. OttesenSCG-928-B03]